MYEIKELNIGEVHIVKRYPFKGFDTIRTKCGPGQICAQCGGPAKFHYGKWFKWFDDSRPVVLREPFCSISCHRFYYYSRSYCA